MSTLIIVNASQESLFPEAACMITVISIGFYGVVPSKAQFAAVVLAVKLALMRAHAPKASEAVTVASTEIARHESSRA